MMQWLSGDLSQGLAFLAGATFDPPAEVKDRRFQPDLSVGVGHIPFDKGRFPVLETPALNQQPASNLYPASLNFPNLAVHLRAGLPWRCDVAVRFADMTTPDHYRVSPTMTGQGQSNSVGATLRKHWLGDDGWPLVSLGLNYNYVFGHFGFQSRFNAAVTQSENLSGPVDGKLAWNVSSVGVNLIVSHNFGFVTPFAGGGYNYATGSVSASLNAPSNSVLVTPFSGVGQSGLAEPAGRIIGGMAFNHARLSPFINGEVQATGDKRWKAWIVQAGVSLPFYIGFKKRANPSEEAPEDIPDKAPANVPPPVFIR